MKTVTIAGKEFGFIEMPNDAVNVVNTGMGYLTFMVTDYSTWVSDEDIWKIGFGLKKEPKQKVKYNTHNGLDVIPGKPIKIPEGNWNYLCCTKTATEKEAKEIVNQEFDTYLNYELAAETGIDGSYTCSTALESLSTLILSLGLNPESNYAIIYKS